MNITVMHMPEGKCFVVEDADVSFQICGRYNVDVYIASYYDFELYTEICFFASPEFVFAKLEEPIRTKLIIAMQDL